MNAIVYSNLGLPDVLQLQEVATPAPKNNEFLIRILATTATAADYQLRSSKTPTAFSLFGLKQPVPIIPGQDMAGEIEAVGRKVTRFRKGDWSEVRQPQEGAGSVIGKWRLEIGEKNENDFVHSCHCKFHVDGVRRYGDNATDSGACTQVCTDGSEDPRA